ncbi:MAG: hypothetical protein U0W65_15525 [Bacteroidia bacterium]
MKNLFILLSTVFVLSSCGKKKLVCKDPELTLIRAAQYSNGESDVSGLLERKEGETVWDLETKQNLTYTKEKLEELKVEMEGKGYECKYE